MPGIVAPMGTIISPRALGAAPVEWQRPADWLTLPTLTAGQQRIVGLFAVYNHDSNFVAFRVTGACTVDWGDGSAPENVANNVTAQHQYVYANLAAGTLSSRGYRQAIVSVTMQAEQTLTAVSFNYRHSQAGLAAYRTPWLDIAVVGASISSLSVGSTTGNPGLLEQFVAVGTLASLTNATNMFYTCYSLQSVALDTGAVTNATYMFNNCSSLQLVALDTSVLEIAPYMFYGCYSLQSVALDTRAVTDATWMFRNCYSLQSVALDTRAVTDATLMFYGCSSLQSVTLDTRAVTDATSMFFICYSLQSVALDTRAVTTTTTMFSGCTSLARATIGAMPVTFSLLNCKLARAQIVEVFTGLPVVVGKTITVTGNWGVPYLTAGDLAIATDKGWAVTT